jgi:hypothetical protein
MLITKARTTAAALIVSMVICVVHAQEFSIDWYVIRGGGGTSTGGGYELSGTIGQPDAGSLAGGGYDMNGGFWPPVAPSCCPFAGDLSDPCNDIVNVSDFTVFAAAYGSSVGDPNYSVCADLSPPGAPNGVINVSDFTVFTGQYGQPCP